MEIDKLRESLKTPAGKKVIPPLILPIASGKGGVGKTTVAVNLALALARHDRTIPVDLDTGTSSVRNTLPGEVQYDLYHFLRKGRPLADFLPTITIKAKDFANEITNFNIKRDDLRTETGITKEHVKNNQEVRKLLIKRNIKPEELPPAEDVKKI